MKKINQNLSEARAEMLLHYLYPEMDDKWTVEHLGTFYRNFNRDLIVYDEETGEVQVARDSFTKLLPSGLLFSENSLKGKGQQSKINKLKDRQNMMHELFQPLDNVFFKRRMDIEREIASLLDTRQQYVLNTYFHYDILIRNILATLFKCEVTCTYGRYSDTDQTRSWIPEITYELIIEELTPESYEQTAKDLEELRHFMQEWFIPFDVNCVMNIKWHNQSMNESKHWMLDYNTELKV